VKLWDTGAGRVARACDLWQHTIEPSRDWIAYTPEGYYDRSAAAGRFIHWRDGDRVLPEEAYEGEFHRPERVRAAMAAASGTGVR
jgi:hypothetical protein